ncbi:MAG: DUF2946 family protein [Bradyrhizobium sp.]|jgi:hypothetical protein|uniref:DUF2946 family protein n=1 Tax=Bradyrhizobium TaxID=374 RepID=UPI000462565A|nr:MULTISPECIES: DUF2946 family protein [Bradyrhizobium]KQT08303.1 hypothetical protein ASG57_09020 [Bradyrhizobium sp. Leaf396]
MTGFAYKRRIGRGTAIVAAYALVLNVILSGMLVASISPLAGAAAQELCISGDNGDAARTDDADKHGKKTNVHCPLCVGHHVSGALPPPQPTLTDRIPLTASAAYWFRQRIVAYARSFDHLSRGPPALT